MSRGSKASCESGKRSKGKGRKLVKLVALGGTAASVWWFALRPRMRRDR